MLIAGSVEVVKWDVASNLTSLLRDKFIRWSPNNADVFSLYSVLDAVEMKKIEPSLL